MLVMRTPPISARISLSRSEPSGPRHLEEALIGGGDDDRPLTGW